MRALGAGEGSQELKDCAHSLAWGTYDTPRSDNAVAGGSNKIILLMHDTVLLKRKMALSTHSGTLSAHCTVSSMHGAALSMHDAASSMHSAASSMHDTAFLAHNAALLARDVALLVPDYALLMHNSALLMHRAIGHRGSRILTQPGSILGAFPRAPRDLAPAHHAHSPGFCRKSRGPEPETIGQFPRCIVERLWSL